MTQRELLIESTLDHTMQPSLFYGSETNEKRPLLVGLHSRAGHGDGGVGDANC